MATPFPRLRRLLTASLAAATLVVLAGCDSRLGPSSTSDAAAGGTGLITGPDGSTLKAGTPMAQTPIGSVVTASLTPTFVVTGGELMFSSAHVQYRFRVTDGNGTVTMDSGLQNGAQWTPVDPLTPTTTYSWTARAEYRGAAGPWSSPAFFTTPVAPGTDYGAWESACSPLASNPTAVVFCVWQFVKPVNSVTDLEVVKRVAWILRGSGGGLLLKSSGENTVPWLGMTFSASRICFKDGHIYKIIGDAGPGGTNSPGWSDNDFVDVSLYVPAINPSLR